VGYEGFDWWNRGVGSYPLFGNKHTAEEKVLKGHLFSSLHAGLCIIHVTRPITV
jgi:hypothetical protein